LSAVILTVRGKKLVVETVSGPTSYTTGGFPLRFSKVDRIDHVIEVRANTGVLAEGRIPAASGNLISVRVYWQTGESGTPMAEVAPGTDLSAITFTAYGIGH
jgi:hypothetical protein